MGDVRGLGLLVALEIDPKVNFTIDDEGLAKWLVRKFKERGLLLRTLSRVIQMSPPLCVTQIEIDLIVEALDSTLTELASYISKG